MRNRLFVRCSGFGVALLLLANVEGRANSVHVVIAKGSGATGKDAAVAIQLQSKGELGCMQFALVYDPAIVEVKGVEAGPNLPEGALIEHNRDQSGWLRAGFVCSPSKGGIKGDGSVLKVIFVVKGQTGGKCPLTLQKTRAWESSDPEMLVTTGDGEFTVVAGIPWLWIAIGGGILLLLLIVLIAMRRGSPKSVAPAYNAPQTSSAVKCEKCGTPNRPGQRFCGQCGGPMPRACSCGQPLREGAVFCTACGTKVG